MNQILEKIIDKKKEDLKEKKRRLSLEELRKQIKAQKEGGSFFKAINEAVNDPAVIAEVKFVSPSRPHPDPLHPCQAGGLLRPPLKREGKASEFVKEDGVVSFIKDLLRRVKEYESAGIDAISIITEPHFFKGSVDFIGKVKEAVKLPILQKDFVIDEYQIYESARKGADALLLISRLVDGKTLKQFVGLCLTEGIEPVVEVYSEEDLEKAIETKTRFIAVNARDLDTFEVDVKRACVLMKKIPDRFVRLGFSGIKSEDEVRQYREAGARGVLVGTALMKTCNIDKFLGGIMK